MKTYKWVSDNKKWAVTEIKQGITLTFFDIMDLTKMKHYSVEVEHIEKGDSLLDGTTAKEDENRLIGTRGIIVPKYLENKLIEISLEGRKQLI